MPKLLKETYFPASTTALPSANFASGVPPTSPSAGDVYNDGGTLTYRGGLYATGNAAIGFSTVPTDPSGFLIAGGVESRFGFKESFNLSGGSNQPDGNGLCANLTQGIFNPNDDGGNVVIISTMGIVESTNAQNIGFAQGIFNDFEFQGTGTLGQLDGILQEVRNSGAGTVTLLRGMYANVTSFGNAGDIHGMHIDVSVQGTGVVSGSMIGILVPSLVRLSGATVSGSAIGLQIEDQSAVAAAVNNWNLYSKGVSSINVFEGAVLTAASTTARAGINFPSGTDPTSPVDGDLFYNGTNLFFRAGASNVDLLAANNGTGFAAEIVGATFTLSTTPTQVTFGSTAFDSTGTQVSGDTLVCQSTGYYQITFTIVGAAPTYLATAILVNGGAPTGLGGFPSAYQLQFPAISGFDTTGVQPLITHLTSGDVVTASAWIDSGTGAVAAALLSFAKL